MKTYLSALASAASLILAMPAMAQHLDVSPYVQDGQLLTGGLEHTGDAIPPTITAYLYDLGEDPFFPFDPADPGVNQLAGVGNLPAGAPLSYNILSSLTYWNGAGSPMFITPPAGTYLTLLMGPTPRTLDEDSGAQAGSLVQSVAANSSVHRHFVSSLFANAGASNVPGEATYIAPAGGIYAFQLELVLGGETPLTSNPFWIVLNNGLTEDQHDAAGAALSTVPEPASLAALACGSAALLLRRRRRT